MGGFLCGCCCAFKQDKEGTVHTPEYKPDFKGPIRGKSRRPKDILCLILFVAFIIGMLSIGVYGWVMGNPSRLLYPVDSKGRLCGFTEGVKDKPNLLFFDWTKCVRRVSPTDLLSGDFETSDLFTCPTQQVCVDECPTENEAGIRRDPVCVSNVDTSQFDVLNSTNPLDALDITSAVSTLIEFIIQEKCAPYYIISEAIGGRCIPTFTDLDNLVDLVNSTNFNETEVPDLSDLVFELTLTDIVNGTLTQALFLNAQVFVFGVLQDLEVVWPAILIGAGITLMVCFFYVLLMRLFSGVVICTGILASLLFIATFSGFSFFQFYCFETGSLNIPSVADGIVNTSAVQVFLNTSEDFAAAGCRFTDPLRDFFSANAPWYEYQKETWLTLGIVSFVMLVILIILVLVFIKKIRISIAIIKEASKAVGYIPGVVLYPIVTWFFIIMTIGFWAVVAIFLYTASEPEYVITNGAKNESILNVTNDTGFPFIAGAVCDVNKFGGEFGDNNSKVVYDVNTMSNITVSCLFNRFFTSNFLLYLQLYMLFGVLWVSNYIIALGECTIAGSFASYYWAWNKSKDIGFFTTPSSFARAVLFHSGSLAFGALIIAIIQLIRIILAYIQSKLKKNKESKIAHAILTCMQCCFYLLEKVFKYINRHAYIEIAIYGYDFCTGACKAVKLILRNVITTAVKDRIVGLLLFMGKIMIVGFIAFLGYLGFGQYEEQGRVLWQRELNYYLVPLIILIILAYLITSGFMAVYHMGVDTIFICALEDQERNNGFDHPYYMSKDLQKLMGVHNRFKEGTDAGNDSPVVKMEDIAL